MQDRDRDDAPADIGAVTRDPPVKRPVEGTRGGVGLAHPVVHGVQHVAPVRDVGHILEAVEIVLAGRGEELVRGDPVGPAQVERVTATVAGVDDTGVEGTPGVRLRRGPALVVEELVADPGDLDRAPGERGALVEHLQDPRAGHVSDDRLVAEREDVEHHPVRQLAGVRAARDIGPQAARVVEHDLDVVGGIGVRVEIVVDRVIDEGSHEGVAVVVAGDRHVRPADLLVDQRLVVGVARVRLDQGLDREILGSDGAHRQPLPGDRDGAGGRDQM